MPLDQIGLSIYAVGQVAAIYSSAMVDVAMLQLAPIQNAIGITLLWTPTVQDWQAIFANLGDGFLYLEVEAQASDSTAPAMGAATYIGNRYGFTVNAAF